MVAEKCERREDGAGIRLWIYAKRFSYTTEGVTVDVVEAEDAGGRYFLATNIAAPPKRILRIFNFIFACLLYNAWVVLNARAQTPMTTIALKLNHIWNFPILVMATRAEASPGCQRQIRIY